MCTLKSNEQFQLETVVRQLEVEVCDTSRQKSHISQVLSGELQEFQVCAFWVLRCSISLRARLVVLLLTREQSSFIFFLSTWSPLKFESHSQRSNFSVLKPGARRCMHCLCFRCWIRWPVCLDWKLRLIILQTLLLRFERPLSRQRGIFKNSLTNITYAVVPSIKKLSSGSEILVWNSFALWICDEAPLWRCSCENQSCWNTRNASLAVGFPMHFVGGCFKLLFFTWLFKKNCRLIF